MEENKFNELLNEIKMICLVYKPKTYAIDANWGYSIEFHACRISQKLENDIFIYIDDITYIQEKQIIELFKELNVEAY